MNEQKQKIEESKIEKPSFVIQIVKIEALDNKRKVIKDPEGNISYQQEDYVGLINLLRVFDSRLHSMQDYKIFLKTKDVITNAWIQDKKEVGLSLDEAKFLKDFLTGFTTTDGKNYQLREFEMRTLVSILEQLE